MNNDKNLQTVKDFLDAFQQGDAKGALAQLGEDIEMVVPGDHARIPWGGRYHGLGGAERLFNILEETVTYEAFEVKDIVGAGTKFVALCTERWRVKATGKVCSQEYAVLFGLRGGKIVTGRTYEDTAAQAAAFQPR